MSNDATKLIERARQGRLVILTGAGISAESGIPTFRGAEGYWTVGAREYHPQEMATLSAFRSMPGEVWRWYLYRLGVCRAAAPNPGHALIVDIEHALGDRFTLITQNVDGLHLRAGNTPSRMCEVHGNIEYRRCAKRCRGDQLLRMPIDLPAIDREQPLPTGIMERLQCDCGSPTRPHVLWFDEYYEEELYRSSTAESAAADCDVIVFIGTSGSTSLPMRAASLAVQSGAALIDINLDDNPFANFARGLDDGAIMRGTASSQLRILADRLLE